MDSRYYSKRSMVDIKAGSDNLALVSPELAMDDRRCWEERERGRQREKKIEKDKER